MMGIRRRASVVIVVAMILIAAFTVASFTHDTIAIKDIRKPDVTPLIEQEMSNPANNIPDQALLLIYSNQKWSGNILDTESHSVTQDGKGDSKIFFTCSKQDSNGNPGFYSLTFQKLKSSGYLELAVVQNGKLLTWDITTAAFGVVGINGNCDQSVSENNNTAGTIQSSSSEANSTSSKLEKPTLDKLQICGQIALYT